MQTITLNQNLCVRCGQCTLVCPSRIFTQQKSSDCPSTIKEAEEICIGCCHCVAVCLGRAITVGNAGPDDCLEQDKNATIRFEHLAHLLRSRRSIRCYSGKPLDDRVVEQLLDVVRWAPTAKNGLPVKWLVINSIGKVKELAGLVMDWGKQQPGFERLVEAWDKGGDPIFRGAPCVIAAYTDDTSPLAGWSPIDTAIAVETLDICAAAMRLGTCWAGIFVRAAQSSDKQIFNKWLGLKETETIHGGLMIGHIGEVTYQRLPYRPEAPKIWIR